MVWLLKHNRRYYSGRSAFSGRPFSYFRSIARALPMSKCSFLVFALPPAPNWRGMCRKTAVFLRKSSLSPFILRLPCRQNVDNREKLKNASFATGGKAATVGGRVRNTVCAQAKCKQKITFRANKLPSHNNIIILDRILFIYSAMKKSKLRFTVPKKSSKFL